MSNANQYGMQTLSNEAISAVTATPSTELGTKIFNYGGRDYVYVYNASTNQQITLNRGVKLASGSTGYSVDVAIAAPTTVSASVLFGVCQNATIPTAYYGYICTRGFMTLENSGSTSISKGDHVFVTTSGTFTMVTGATWSSAYLTNHETIACEDQTTTTTGTFTAYVKTIG